MYTYLAAKAPYQFKDFGLKQHYYKSFLKCYAACDGVSFLSYCKNRTILGPATPSAMRCFCFLGHTCSVCTLPVTYVELCSCEEKRTMYMCSQKNRAALLPVPLGGSSPNGCSLTTIPGLVHHRLHTHVGKLLFSEVHSLNCPGWKIG